MRLYRQELASSYVLTAIVFGVLSILGTRLFLQITDYPSIGNEVWHLSHTIWGGIVMCIGMFMAISFYGRRSMRIACAVFGTGMGMFFDEIGKFVTRDNNYFFKPTSMMIYVIFLLLIGVHRLLNRRGSESGVHLFYHVLDRLGDLAENDLDSREQKRLVEVVGMLKKRADDELSAFSHELEKALTRLVAKPYKPSRTKRLVNSFWSKLYQGVLLKKGVLALLVGISLVFSIASVIDTLWLFSNIKDISIFPYYLGEYAPQDGFEMFMLLVKVLSDLVVAGMFLLAIFNVLRKKYFEGLEYFEDGLVVYILLTTIARFYFEQFSAVLGLMFCLAVLYFVRRLKLEKKA